MLFESFPKAWSELLREEARKEYLFLLEKKIEEAYASSICFPPKEKIFEAFRLCSPKDVKVVILGQDPYHGAGEAHGLAFSVRQGIKTPPSLRNIFKELESEFGIDLTRTTDLTVWADQGVFLLNSVLTVEKDRAGSHSKYGWEEFTNAVISFVSKENEHVVFVLWGDYARKKKNLIDLSKHAVIESAHPSPLSSYRGFFGSKPFSGINNQLKEWGKAEINW
jgi:uracil-DNA glycosylase